MPPLDALITCQHTKSIVTWSNQWIKQPTTYIHTKAARLLQKLPLPSLITYIHYIFICYGPFNARLVPPYNIWQGDQDSKDRWGTNKQGWLKINKRKMCGKTSILCKEISPEGVVHCSIPWATSQSWAQTFLFSSIFEYLHKENARNFHLHAWFIQIYSGVSVSFSNGVSLHYAISWPRNIF